MNTSIIFSFFHIFTQIFVGNVADRSCEIKPTDVEELHVSVFFDLRDDKREATEQLFDKICRQYHNFGDKMSVTFRPIAWVEGDSQSIGCESGEYCKNALEESCAMVLADDEKKYICCRKDKETCYTENGTSLDEVMNCADQGYNTEAGKRLLHNRRKMEDADCDDGKLPAMLFNDEDYDECIDNEAYDHFAATCCRMYKHDHAPKPPC